MPKRRKSSKRRSSSAAVQSESAAERMDTNLIAQLINDPTLSADAVISSDAIVSFELLGKVFEPDSAEGKVLKAFQQEQATFLVEAVKLLKSNREIQHAFGNNMVGARRLASVLKGRSKTLAFEELIDDSVEAVVKKMQKFNPDVGEDAGDAVDDFE